MITPEESLGIDSETYNRIVDECIYGEQKPAEWSEEDSLMIDETLFYIDEFQKSDRCKNENDMQNSVTCEKWLKSLKDRVQLKQEWGEEGEGNVDIIISRLEVDIEYWESRSKRRVDEDKRVINWLKSLKPQSTWKPSKEQMQQLGWVAEQNEHNLIGKELMTLYKDLKKLKG